MPTLVEREAEEVVSNALREAEEARRSILLRYLPAVFSQDKFMRDFLKIFEDTLKPLMQLSDNLHYYFNPLTAPSEMLQWLAGWVALALDESWEDEQQRRRLIRAACQLYSRRGTKRGLSEYLQLYTGIEPQIDEYTDGMTLGLETFLGINTTIAGRERHSFTVTVRLENLSQEELARKEEVIRRIIEAEKPAHTTYRLNLLTGADSPQIRVVPGGDEDDRGNGGHPPGGNGNNPGPGVVPKVEEPFETPVNKDQPQG